MTIEQSAAQHALDEMMADFTAYLNPEYFLRNISTKIKAVEANKEGIEKYQELLRRVNWAWVKIRKYPLYFEQFYPADESDIEDFEALDHHITAYLEDMTTLKNKLTAFFSSMRNDIKKVATNRADIEEFFNAAIEKTIEGLEQVKEHRDPHRHSGSRFFDGDLLEAENAHNIIQMFQKEPFAEIINPDALPAFLKEQEKKKIDAFKRAKGRWIDMAKRNDAMTEQYLNNIIGAIQPPLYQFLKVQSVKSLT